MVLAARRIDPNPMERHESISCHHGGKRLREYIDVDTDPILTGFVARAANIFA